MIKSQVRSNLIAFFAAAYVLPLYLLLLSGFPTIDAIKVCSMIFLQIVTGGVIWIKIIKPENLDLFEAVGLGLAIGSILSTVGHLIFRATAIDAIGWMLPLPIAFFLWLPKREAEVRASSAMPRLAYDWLFIGFAITVILKQWFWLAPIFVALTCALIFFKSKRACSGVQTLVFFGILGLSVVSLFALYLRNLNSEWLIRSWDISYFESVSYSIAKFGSSENISLVGYPNQYHWFGLAWLGSITISTNLQPFLAVTQVLPIYSAITVACLIYGISRRTTTSGLTKFVILLGYIFVAGSFSTSNPPNIVSSIWLFASVVTVHEYFTKRNFSTLIALIVFVSAAMTSKISTGYTLATAFVLTDLWLSRRNPTDLKKSFARSLMFGAAMMICFLIVFGGPDRIGNSFVEVSLRNAAHFFGVDRGRAWPIVLIGTVGFILLLIPASVILLSNRRSKEPQQALLIFCAIGFASVLIPTILFEDNLGFFVLSAKTLAVIGSAITLANSNSFFVFMRQATKLKLFTFLSSLSLLAYLAHRLSTLNWREISSIKGGPVPIQVLINLVYFTIAFFSLKIFLYSTNIERGLHRSSKNFLFAFGLFWGAMASGMIDHAVNLPSQFGRETSQTEFAGSESVRNASNWISQNASDDDVIATNRFCVESNTSFCLFPNYFGVSSTSRRKVLIEGPVVLFGRSAKIAELEAEDESFYPEFARERLDLSRGFADAPTAEITARLKELGVGWFYLFLDNTTNRDWSPYATIEYQNDEVAILKLVGSS
jgi:hypothetical protein